MAGSAVLSAIQWIGPLLVQEGKLLYSVHNGVQKLQEELEILQPYLEDADIRQEDRQIGALISQVRKLAYDAEDVIDTYMLIVQAGPKQIDDVEGYRRRLSRHARFLFNACNIRDVRKRIEEIHSSLNQITVKFSSYGVRNTPKIKLPIEERYRGQKPENFSHDDDHNNYIVGWEKDISTLVQVLMGEEMSQIRYLTIVGMGGSGKSTLARKLYNHPFIKDCFNLTAWVFISQEWSTQDILYKIYKKVGGSKDLLHASKGELVHELRHILTSKLYLIVLDDVWRREALEDILPALPRGDANRGSKIVITTRNLEITQFSNLEQNAYTYEPQPLSEEEAWELYSKIVLSRSSHFNIGNYVNLAKGMLKKCDGLPLAIVALCGILNTKCNINEWQQVNEVVRLRVMDGTTAHMYGRVGELLALSYDDLPYYLKSCFLYLAVFPEDCQIPTGMLTRMWIAEGLITADDRMSLEEVAIQRLEELSFRFLVQIARSNFKGEIKAIRLHDLLRDLCIKKAKQQSFLKVYASIDCLQSSGVPEPRHAALLGSVPFPTQVSNLRSITMLTRSNLSHSACASKETLDLHIVYMNFKLLRLLNLWGIKTLNGKLPTTIGSLFHLRYLGIRTSNIIELPASIGNLGNLLVLDYRNVDSDNMFPIKIPKTLGKLVQLRHLFLPIESPWSLEALPLSAMKNLRTLWGIKGDGSDNWLSREVAHLSTTLKKLKIVVSTQTELEKTFNVVSNINALCTFHCEMRNNVSLQRMEHPLSTHQQLHKLIVVGKINMKLDLILPCNLVMLELKNSIMNNEDPMEAIGRMQHLKLLRMSNSYQERKFTSKRDSFPQLEELYLENLANLEEWTIEEGSMLCLKKIHIFKCKKLSYPKGLLFVTTLQELEYHIMHKKFVQEACECGWSDVRFRLPYNYEVITGQSDNLILDTSSVSKIYEQLTVGIYLHENLQKYWVTKQGDRYYNCFMLNGDTLLKGFTKQREYWEKIRITERKASPRSLRDNDRALLDVSEKELHEPSIREEYLFPVSFEARNLNLGITYKFAFVVMLPERFPLIDRKPLSANLIVFGEKRRHPRDSMDMDADPDYLSEMIRMDDDSHRHKHKLHNKPRNEWIHLLAGTHEILDTTKILMFSLSGLMDEIVIKGVIIEPVFDTQTTVGIKRYEIYSD